MCDYSLRKLDEFLGFLKMDKKMEKPVTALTHTLGFNLHKPVSFHCYVCPNVGTLYVKLYRDSSWFILQELKQTGNLRTSHVVYNEGILIFRG